MKVAPIEEMDDEINRKIIDLNLTSTIMSCRTFALNSKNRAMAGSLMFPVFVTVVPGPVGRSIRPPKQESMRLQNACGIKTLRDRGYPFSSGRFQYEFPKRPKKALISLSGMKRWLCAPNILPIWSIKPARSRKAVVSPRWWSSVWPRILLGSRRSCLATKYFWWSVKPFSNVSKGGHFGNCLSSRLFRLPLGPRLDLISVYF